MNIRYLSSICLAAALAGTVSTRAADPIVTYNELLPRLTAKDAPLAVFGEAKKVIASDATPSEMKTLYQAKIALLGGDLSPRDRLSQLLAAQVDPVLMKSPLEQPINSAIGTVLKEIEENDLSAFLNERHKVTPSDPRIVSMYISKFGLNDVAGAAAMVDACAAANPTGTFALQQEMLGLYSRAEAPKTDALPLLANVRAQLENNAVAESDPTLWSSGLRVYTRGLKEADKGEDAAKFSLAIISTYPDQIRYLGPVILESGSSAQLTASVPILYAGISKLVLSGATCYEEHELLASVLLKLQRYDEALHEGKILLAYSPRYQQSIDILVAAFKGQDGHLGRLNALLAFHQHGMAGKDAKVGTPDDLVDPLAGISRSTSKERAAVFAKLTSQISTIPYEQRSRRATACLLQELPEAALDEWLAAFAYCPMDPTKLQDTSNDLADFVLRTTRNPEWAQAIVAFRTYGAAGPDGTMKTDDDVIDPVPAIRKLLAASYAN